VSDKHLAFAALQTLGEIDKKMRHVNQISSKAYLISVGLDFVGFAPGLVRPRRHTSVGLRLQRVAVTYSQRGGLNPGQNGCSATTKKTKPL
jgi:hypothetical protein